MCSSCNNFEIFQNLHGIHIFCFTFHVTYQGVGTRSWDSCHILVIYILKASNTMAGKNFQHCFAR